MLAHTILLFISLFILTSVVIYIKEMKLINDINWHAGKIIRICKQTKTIDFLSGSAQIRSNDSICTFKISNNELSKAIHYFNSYVVLFTYGDTVLRVASIDRPIPSFNKCKQMAKKSHLLGIAMILSFMYACAPADSYYYVSNLHSCDGVVAIHRDIYIDDSFTEIEIKSINTAFVNWFRATNKIIDYKIVGKVPHIEFFEIPEFGGVNDIYIYKQHNSPAISTHGGLANRKVILVNMSLIKNNLLVLTEVVMHEQGHTFGLGHTDDPDAVMATVCNSACNNTQLTLSDINLFCRSGKLIDSSPGHVQF